MSMEIAKPTARISSGFRRVVAAFLAGEGLPFSQVLSAERIERILRRAWLPVRTARDLLDSRRALGDHVAGNRCDHESGLRALSGQRDGRNGPAAVDARLVPAWRRGGHGSFLLLVHDARHAAQPQRACGHAAAPAAKQRSAAGPAAGQARSPFFGRRTDDPTSLPLRVKRCQKPTTPRRRR